MQGVLISIGISQLQQAMEKQEKEHRGAVLYLLSNEEQGKVKSSVLTIWVQKPDDLKIIQRATLRELIEMVDTIHLAKIVPPPLLSVLPKFDFALIEGFLDKITHFIADLEAEHKGTITLQIQNVKIKKRIGHKYELRIKKVVHRPGLADDVIESCSLHDFVVFQIERANHPKLIG